MSMRAKRSPWSSVFPRKIHHTLPPALQPLLWSTSVSVHVLLEADAKTVRSVRYLLWEVPMEGNRERGQL